ncbi:MAG: DNA polymerase I [Spirochaetaceae bacterium]|nr:MAG: DNA polymerase I [Spirochaetaceae bacterium]
MKPLYLLDAYSLVYRSYFAFIRRPLRDSQGKNVSAIFGFFRSFLSFLQQYDPQYFGVILDSRTPTFRHERYAEYKGTRDKTPEDLTEQIPFIEEALEALGVPQLRRDGFEADDLIATLAERCRKEGRACYVISGDKDLLQLVAGNTRVLKPSDGSFEDLGRDEVYAAWGVYPEQIRDYLSLVGDSSDNIPGVKGIGAKGAVALLERYTTLDGIYENLGDVSSASQKKKLEEGRDSALLSRELVTLIQDVDLPTDAEDLRLNRLFAEKAFELFAERGMNSVIEQLRAVSAVGAARVAAGPKTTVLVPDLSPTKELQEPDRSGYKQVSSIDELQDWIGRARQAKVLAFDCETTGLEALVATPVGFSLCVAPGEACYIPLFGPDGVVLEEEPVREALRELLETDPVAVVGQNIKYDYQVMLRWGVRIKRIMFDTMLAAWLIDSGISQYGMDALAERFLGLRTLHYADVVPAGENGKPGPFHTTPLDLATSYAAEDADITLRLYEALSPLLAEARLESLMQDIEMPIVPILADMELRGIGLNGAVLKEYSVELTKSLGAIEAEIHRLAGHEFNIASTKQLQEVLFTERKLKPIKKTKTGYSTDTDVLQQLAAEDPVPEKVLRYRQLAKLKSTYVDTLPALVNPETGRLHTHFVQTGTATGRLSSKDPNLQNIPIRDEEGRRIRAAFVPDTGSVFVSADYSQIELVVLAHLSQDPGLLAAFRSGQDVHRSTASDLFGVALEEVSADQRRVAKTINFGVMYGMSAFRLAGELGIPRGRAAEFIDAYFAKYSGIRGFIDATVAEAEQLGVVRTMFGRQRLVRDINNRNKTVKAGAERIAVNTPIQGSAADIVKRAMVLVRDRLEREQLQTRMLLQVHDELILEAPEAEREAAEAVLREEMPRAAELSLPLRVNVESGYSWGDLH